MELIRTKNFVEFYIGRNGEFDELATSVIKRVQKQLDHSKSALILTLPYSVKDIEYYYKYYDEIVIPEMLYGAHPKAAITLRNRWMVGNSDLIIAYIYHEKWEAWGEKICCEFSEDAKLKLYVIRIAEKSATIVKNASLYYYVRFKQYRNFP